MITTSEVTLAICHYIASTGEAVYKEANYLPSDKAITVKHLPTMPDTAVAVTVYDMGDSVGTNGSEIMLQLRFRAGGSRTAVDDFADAIAMHLHNKYRFDMGTFRITRSRRMSIAPLGPDENNRQERTDNYGLFIVR